MRTYLLNVPSIFFNTVRLLAGWPMVVFVSWVVLHRYTSFTILDFMLTSIFLPHTDSKHFPLALLLCA